MLSPDLQGPVVLGLNTFNLLQHYLLHLLCCSHAGLPFKVSKISNLRDLAHILKGDIVLLRQPVTLLWHSLNHAILAYFFYVLA